MSRGTLLPILALAAWPALACKCPAAFTPCGEASTSDLVFIGTVESVAPKFLDAWNPGQMEVLRNLNAKADAARQDQSDSNLVALRDTYLKIFPDLPEESRRRLSAAKTHDDLVKSFYFIVNQGRLVRMKVRAKFKEGGGDDDEKSDVKKIDKKGGKKPAQAPAKAAKDDDDDLGTIDVWTPFDDCGVAFETGETYLVYADNDEESAVISTSSCTRTRRVSDAGEDLAYLFFLKADEKRASELDGYLTTNQNYQKDFSNMAEPSGVNGAVTEGVVELTQGNTVRYASPDVNGRFVFDGLTVGEYALNVYAAGYPRKIEPLAGPKHGVLRDKSCGREIILLTKPVGPR